VIVAVVMRVAVEKKRIMINKGKNKEEGSGSSRAVQVVLVVKRKQMIAIKEKM